MRSRQLTALSVAMESGNMKPPYYITTHAHTHWRRMQSPNAYKQQETVARCIKIHFAVFVSAAHRSLTWKAPKRGGSFTQSRFVSCGVIVVKSLGSSEQSNKPAGLARTAVESAHLAHTFRPVSKFFFSLKSAIGTDGRVAVVLPASHLALRQ